MRQLSPNLCRQDGHDLGPVLSVASRQGSEMIEWLIGLLSLRSGMPNRSELISIQQKGEMKMPQGMTSMSSDRGMSKEAGSGHLYMQTNETRNAVIHYQRSGNGTLTEIERVATGGAGS